MIVTDQNRAFIEAEQYSDFILENMHDGLIPDGFYRDVSDFNAGETLNIKTIGEAQIQEVTEDVAMKYSPIETGEVQLTITDYVGDAWYVSDKMRQDGAQIEQLLAARGRECIRAIQERFETRFFEVCEAIQTDADPNNINSQPHRLASAETNNTITLDHIIQARLSFNKAEVPTAGRVGFIDPVCEATLERKFQVTASALDANPTWQMITESGMSREHSFVTNLYGFDIITSNRLPTGDFGDGTTSVTGAVANIFMCVADDHCKPVMACWREHPKVEGERNKDMRRDEFVQAARWGIGIQRTDTLFVLITSASATA